MSYSVRALDVALSIDRIRINHTRFMSAMDGVARVIQVGNHTKQPVGVTVVAPAGSGKSLLIDCVRNNVCDWPFLRRSGVLVASLKESPSVAQIQGDLLECFHYAVPTRSVRSTNNAMFNVLTRAIAQHSIQLIALDEFQHVFLARQNDVRASVGDWLKRLMTETCVPVLLAGTEMLRTIEEADPQLSSRIAAIFTLPSFENDSDWIGLLSAFASASKDIDLSILPTKLATPMFKATRGNLRELKWLVKEAAMCAVDANVDVVGRDHFREAHVRHFGPDSGRSNPFE